MVLPPHIVMTRLCINRIANSTLKGALGRSKLIDLLLNMKSTALIGKLILPPLIIIASFDSVEKYCNKYYRTPNE